MRHALALAFSASAAIAFAAAPANAATVVYSSGSTITVTPSSVPNTYDAPFEFQVLNTVPGAANGQFTATFTFDAPFAGTASAIAQNIIVRGRFGSDVDFTGASLNGVAGTVLDIDAFSRAVVIDAPVGLGTNWLTFIGRLNPHGSPTTIGTGNALVTGSLTMTATAVPEPATWAMLVLGFGLIGGGMRRRTVRTRPIAA